MKNEGKDKHVNVSKNATKAPAFTGLELLAVLMALKNERPEALEFPVMVSGDDDKGAVMWDGEAHVARDGNGTRWLWLR